MSIVIQINILYRTSTNYYSFSIKNATKFTDKIYRQNSQSQSRLRTNTPNYTQKYNPSLPKISFPSNHIRLEIFPSIETQTITYRCAQSPFSFPRR